MQTQLLTVPCHDMELSDKALLLDQEMALIHVKVHLKSQAPKLYHISVFCSLQQQGKFLPKLLPTPAPGSTGLAALTHTNKSDK